MLRIEVKSSLFGPTEINPNSLNGLPPQLTAYGLVWFTKRHIYIVTKHQSFLACGYPQLPGTLATHGSFPSLHFQQLCVAKMPGRE